MERNPKPDGKKISEFKNWFENAAGEGVETPEIVISSSDELASADKEGKIFLSTRLFTENYTSNERKTVSLHELAHLSLNHLKERKRLYFLFTFMGTFLLFLPFLMMAQLLLFPNISILLIPPFYLGLAVIWILLIRHFNEKLIQQEVESDRLAVEKTDPKYLISFLEKINEPQLAESQNNFVKKILNQFTGKSLIEKRIEALKNKNK